ncbi:hypothetical protein [Flavobacterium sp.]|uniref:hypothetical protein n=1 Tax=Flavobacterium sp. TaxID=239 RepID=UPI00286BCE33|nr:hypothetical protein [Flavobacterium sp.]
MKVKCLIENIDPVIHNKKLVEWSNNSELEITQGKIYTVIAISKYSDILFYNIIGDESGNYPLAFPVDLFEIIDNRVSKYWNVLIEKIGDITELELQNNDVISFNEWTLKKDCFYENLLEQEKHEISVFKNYKDKMFFEFQT